MSEELRLPVAPHGIGASHKAIGDGAATRQEECSALVLAITGFYSRASGEPVTGSAFYSAGVAANRVSQHEALVGIPVDVLVVDKEVRASEVNREAFGADGLDAQVHMRQKGQPCKVNARVPDSAAWRVDRAWVVIRVCIRVQRDDPA